MARVVMHVDLDAFYASVEQLKHPELRGQPVIVGGLGLAGERGVVSAASYEARAFGVRSAMPLTRARRLCPKGNFVPADFAAYRQASRQVFRILTDYSPTIEPLSLDEAYLDLTGSEALLGPVAEVAAGLQARVRRECGLDISVGVATGKVVAKVASDLRKPRGLVIVPAGQEAAFLGPLPLSRLPGCGPATIVRLESFGIRTVGQVAATSEALLGELFGKYGRVLHAHARGIDPTPVEPPGEPKSISREVTFERDLLEQGEILSTGRSLLLDVAESLRGQGLAARTVTLKLRYQPFETHSRQATLPVASDRDDALLEAFVKLVREHLEAGRPVRLIGAGVANLEVPAIQLDLLESRSGPRSGLDAQLDRLRQRFGPTAISRGAAVQHQQKDFRRDDIDAISSGDG
ncbi:MAG TPA: DNA polymerase IV [Candidatus Eisenbacteria bacterium]|nr:DNA polymerase IV [Candidatus Eisenbacteria bacterium]